MTFFPEIRSTTPGAFALGGGAEPAPGVRLRRVRGRGGFAEVWEADSPAGPVALKFMPCSNTGTTAREVRSIQSFAALDHPHLVKTHGVWTVPGYVVVGMELAEGTLLDLMLLYHNDLGQPIPPAQLGLYLSQVAGALDFLNARRHERAGRTVGFQHGDVKPNNVLLFGDTAKLTDYGLATPTHGPATPCPRHGTRDYAAPEVLNGYQADTSDQYGLAVMYHVLRTGAFPFPPAPVGELPKGFVRPPPDLSLVPEAERPVLARALAAAPADRFPKSGEFARRVLEAQGLMLTRSADGAARVVSAKNPTP
ncbi:MAG: protein kinase [Gemmataceae bacterium]|nr:protein kinase [Gemmataceae bacterium]